MNYRIRKNELLHIHSTELFAIIFLALVFAFGLTFRMWGDEVFDPVLGTINLIFVFLGMIVMVAFHEMGHKISAAIQGYESRIIPYTAGLVFSSFIIIYSRGFLPVATPNLLQLDARPDLRLDKWRKYDTPKNMSAIAIGGIVGGLIGITFFKLLFLLTAHPLFLTIMLGGVIHSMLSLIPFELLSLFKLKYFSTTESHPPSDGMHIILWSRKAWVVMLLWTIIFGGVAMISGTISFIFTLLLALITTWAYDKWEGIA